MRSYYGIFRQSPEALKKRMARYVEYFNGCKTVLDLGCGRGEFLDLLKKAGINAVGVDKDPDMIKICKKAGFEIVREDIFEFLKKNIKFDGIFASHIIEHHYGEDIENLFRLCYNSLNPRGKLIVVTPNPENLLVITKSFWLDLSHLRPYPLELLTQMFIDVGFSIVSAGEDPNSQDQRLAARIKRFTAGKILTALGTNPLNKYLFSALDIFIIGTRH